MGAWRRRWTPDGGRDTDAYYHTHLAGERLRRCYDLAPPRVRRYLEAEVEHVRTRLDGATDVLELGCGYGRVLATLAGPARPMGIDTSLESLRLAARLAGRPPRYRIACMDAARLGVPAAAFDAVVCVQNGVRALSAAPLALLREALRVTRPGGVVLLSTYAEEFWPHRLEWFERQAEAGLIGRIDRSRTVAGTIVCEDGLRLGTFAPADFLALAAAAAVDGQLTRVDGSSLVWEVRVGRSRRAD